jgi:hypothetical protein
MKTMKKYLFALLVTLLGLGLALIGANRGDEITDISRFESDALLRLNTKVEVSKTAVPRDVLKSLPDVKIGWTTLGSKFVVQTFDLNGETCILINSKPGWGKNVKISVRPVARSESPALDAIISDFERSSNITTGGYVLVGQPAFLQVMGTTLLLMGAMMWIVCWIFDIKNKKLNSW